MMMVIHLFALNTMAYRQRQRMEKRNKNKYKRTNSIQAIKYFTTFIYIFHGCFDKLLLNKIDSKAYAYSNMSFFAIYFLLIFVVLVTFIVCANFSSESLFVAFVRCVEPNAMKKPCATSQHFRMSDHIIRCVGKSKSTACSAL